MFGAVGFGSVAISRGFADLKLSVCVLAGRASAGCGVLIAGASS
jgi:hypothetical protein